MEVGLEGHFLDHFAVANYGPNYRPLFGEVFAEGSLPERHTLVLEKGSIFCEVFAEGSLPERHSQVLR